MKKILLVAFILLSFVDIFGQGNMPVNQPIGSQNSENYTLGLQGAVYGYRFRGVYADTAALNLAYGGVLKTIPGLLMKAGDDLYLRNVTAVKWIKIASTAAVGTVTSFSATDGNGFDFTVTNPTTTPTLTATTNVGNNRFMYSNSGAITGDAAILHGGTGQLILGVAGVSTGSLAIAGTTSGSVGITTQAAAGAYNFNMPITSGSSGQFLTSGGGGSTAMTWTSPSAITIPISSLTAAVATNTINNANYSQQWQWNSLADINALYLSSTSTAAAANSQVLFGATLSGANSNASQTTQTAVFDNQHTGTTSTNIALRTTATSGTTNIAGWFSRGSVNLGTVGQETGLLNINGATSGTVGLTANATAGTWTLTLPSAVPAGNGYLLQSTTTGISSWVNPTSIVTATPTLTANQIAVGDGSNQMTSSSALKFTAATPSFQVFTPAGTVELGDLSAASNGNKLILSDATGIGYWDNTAHTALFGFNKAVPTEAVDVVGGINATDTINVINTATNARMVQLYNDVSNTPKFGVIKILRTLGSGDYLELRNDNVGFMNVNGSGFFNKITYTTPPTHDNVFYLADSSGTIPLRVKLNATTYSPDSKGTIDLGTTTTGTVTGTGTANNMTKFTGTSSIGNALMTDDGSVVTLASPATTGNGFAATSSTITTGNLMSLTNTGTAATSNTKNVLAIVSSGANATASQTVTGQTISVTNTGTTNTNNGLTITASGATTNNALTITAGDVLGPATQNLFNTVTTTGTLFGAATTLTIGGTPTTAITHSYSTNATATATTKTLNIGTGGAAGSTTNLNVASAIGGTTSILSPIVSIPTTAAVINIGGGATTAKMRFFEPSASGSNYSEFSAVAQGANITYSLPASVGAAGTVLTDVVGNGVLTWELPVPPAIASGAYTPTITNGDNVTASTAYGCQYLRVGNTITVSGKIDIDPTLTATSTFLDIDLPVNGLSEPPESAGGTGFCPNIAALGLAILGNGANTANTVRFQFVASDVSNRSFYFTFTYIVE